MWFSHFFHRRKEIRRDRLYGHLAACAVWPSKLVGWVLVLLTACQSAPVTPAPAPALTVPPVLRALETSAPMTLVPPQTPTPIPTLAATPTAIPVVLDKWLPYQDPGKQFTFRFPPDWGGRGYTQAITRTVRALSVDTIVLRGLQGTAGPEFVMLYNWPALDPTQPPANATAWSSVAGLAKLFLYPDCMTTFDSPAPVTLAGQQVMGVKFVAQCDRLYAGYLVGIVNRGVNYGLVVDVRMEDWDAWQPTFETIFASFAFGP
jgi:hypothetical protein